MHLVVWLTRICTLLVSWTILMGVPALLFSPPLDGAEMKRFLGVFYALLLGVGALVGRSWGGVASTSEVGPSSDSARATGN